MTFVYILAAAGVLTLALPLLAALLHFCADDFRETNWRREFAIVGGWIAFIALLAGIGAVFGG